VLVFVHDCVALSTTLGTVESIETGPSRLPGNVNPPEPNVSWGVVPADPDIVIVPFLKVSPCAARSPSIVIVFTPVALVPAEKNKSSVIAGFKIPGTLAPVESADQNVSLPHTPVVESAEPLVTPLVSQYRVAPITEPPLRQKEGNTSATRSLKNPTDRRIFEQMVVAASLLSF